MDIKMPPGHSTEGIDAAHVIKRELPGTGIVILTQHDDEVYACSLLSHVVAGYGYLHKVRVGDVDELVRAVEMVGAGGSVLDLHIVQKLVDHRSHKPGSTLSTLTPAELDVLRRMADKSNTAIATALSISMATVERRINVLFQKLGLSEESDLNRRVSAVLIYLRESPPGL
jgi:DNA-binding NarL/FixJ family response regulator